MADEMQQLVELTLDEEWAELAVRCVLTELKCGSVKELFERFPEEAFELHEQVMMIAEDTGAVGEFEHDLEREVIRREDLA